MHSDVGTCLGFQELTLGIQLEFIDEEDKKTILDTIKETTEWIEEYGQGAGAEELEEKTHVCKDFEHAGGGGKLYISEDWRTFLQASKRRTTK